MLQPDLRTRQAPLHWRIGAAGDSAAIAHFAATAFDPAFREAWTESQIAAMVADPSGWLDVARDGPEAAAPLLAFALSRVILDEVELLLCATHPQMRRQGAGRAMVARVCESARQRGARRIFLEVRASNLPARALYEAFGFVSAGRRPGYYRSVAGDSIDALTLSYALPC